MNNKPMEHLTDEEIKEIRELAAMLGCSENLVYYLTTIESRVSASEEMIDNHLNQLRKILEIIKKIAR